MKKADASGADYAILIGENEVVADSVLVKPLRDTERGQHLVKIADLSHYFNNLTHRGN
jgi:histidyl-tRNA synthetase